MQDSRQPIDQLWACYPELGQIPEQDVREIFASSRTVDMPAGVQLLRESEPCRQIMWLLGGRVRVFKHSPEGREITLYRVEPGDLCVLSLHCLFTGEGFPAEARSESPVAGLVLSQQAIDRALDECRGFRRYILALLSRRMSEMVDLVAEVSFNRLELRLACLLGQFFERSAGAPLKVTHIQLAREIGTTREMVSRILKNLEHKGCIRLRRGEIHLLSEEALDWFSRSA
ncbi:Crp/Fnr family transcriptional regulator [Thiohalobacter sp.]|uniref:Crp/Fnr family transcriptional regulator n=1 Tax=Thiohalobacter sp. TaxID=2025948 RepID=UPI0026398CB8|nr:Crp/Fnr family transcriptional regulator [Thiohalobacter sp.]